MAILANPICLGKRLKTDLGHDLFLFTPTAIIAIRMHRLVGFGIFLAFIFFLTSIFFSIFLSPVGSSSEIKIFTVPENQLNYNVIEELYKQKFLKNKQVANFIFYVFGDGAVQPGGYELADNMDTLSILKKISSGPDLVWFTFSACQRKEQIGEKLSNVLKWNAGELNEWNDLYKNENVTYFEGVYYPDTYLIPINETPTQVAERFIGRFNEKLSPLADDFAAQNIKWTTGLKIASLIAREAGGISDMGIISGVIWNRLEFDMPLQIDATMQYTLGKNKEGGWWGSINLDQKRNPSPYNSYLNKGLPPTPICSPDINAIEAALFPVDTDCIYYLHDSIGDIHCETSYADHLLNIEKYLY